MRRMILFYAVLLSGMSCQAIWAQTICHDEIFYEINTNTMTAEVVAGDSPYTGSVVIPDSIVIEGKTYHVTSVGDEAFYNCDALSSVKIGKQIERIGSSSFQKCTTLREVNIPNGVLSIGGYAFSHCDQLVKVTLGENLKTIGIYAFAECRNLRKVVIPDSVSQLKDYAFSNCVNLRNVVLGKENGYFNCRII